MYFPYLYSKASELLALRSFAGKLGAPQKIIPVIEPVTAAAGLERLYVAFKRTSDVAYVVENPHLIDLKSSTALAAWSVATRGLFADPAVVRPAFKERDGVSATDISDFVSRHPGRPIGLVVTTTRITAAALKTALGSSDFTIFMTSDADRVNLVTEFGPGRLVEVNNRFPQQRVNSDYSGEEWLTRDHLDYATTHKYAGFSDYTILPELPTKGGGAPGAVAIHLTFPASDSTFWVQHFVSDETDRAIGTAGTKLLEAIDHLDAAIVADPAKFPTSSALAEYRAMAASRRQSSLGKNKELELAHHVHVVAGYLGL